MNFGRENTWWIVVPKCLPLAIPVDLAAKAHDDGRYTVFLGTYVQAYKLCNPPHGEPEAKTPPPISEIRRSGPPARRGAPPIRKRLAGPPVRVRPAPLAVDEVFADAAMIERIKRRFATDGLPIMPETVDAVRRDLVTAVERYERARAAGEELTYPKHRLIAVRSMLAAMEEL